MNPKGTKNKHSRIFVKNDKLTEEAQSACKALHIDPNLLFLKPKEYFKKDGVSNAIAEIRQTHYEEKREAFLEEIEDYLKGVGLRSTNTAFMRR